MKITVANYLSSALGHGWDNDKNAKQQVQITLHRQGILLKSELSAESGPIVDIAIQKVQGMKHPKNLPRVAQHGLGNCKECNYPMVEAKLQEGEPISLCKNCNNVIVSS